MTFYGAIGSIGDNLMLFLEVQMKKKKWKLYLYYNGVLIKKLRISEDEAPAQNSYAIRVYFKKQLFKNVIAGVVVKPIRLLKNDEIKGD